MKGSRFQEVFQRFSVDNFRILSLLSLPKHGISFLDIPWWFLGYSVMNIFRVTLPYTEQLYFKVFDTRRPRACLLCLSGRPSIRPSVGLSHLRSAGSAKRTSNKKLSLVPRTLYMIWYDINTSSRFFFTLITRNDCIVESFTLIIE